MTDYSFLVGVWKTVKNGAIFWAPAILAFLSNVPMEYAGAATIAIYLFKNWYEMTQTDKNKPLTVTNQPISDKP